MKHGEGQDVEEHGTWYHETAGPILKKMVKFLSQEKKTLWEKRITAICDIPAAQKQMDAYM